MTKYSGWIIRNGHITSNKFTELFDMLQNAAMKSGLEAKIVKHHELVPLIDNGRPTLIGNYSNEKPDFILFWDKDVRLARHLENMGFRLYNSAQAIENCDDKSLTHQVLSKYGISMPKTITSPLLFPNCDLTDYTFYEYVEDELGYPFVIKEVYGSFGMQVHLVRDHSEFMEKVNELKHKPHVYQQFIQTSSGKDIRLHVVGDEVVATMMRKSESDFRANVTNGGKMYQYTPTEDQAALAVKASKLLGADFAGVDLLFGENDEPIICEVNSNAHMKNILSCTGIDVSEFIMDYIYKDLEAKK